MMLNSLKPNKGAKFDRKRVGRGPGSGLGKTSGRGHKGQKARSGGYKKRRIGFEGGQMPLQRRLPKSGFKSRVGFITAKIRLMELNAIEGDTVTISTLKDAGIIRKNMKRAKIFLAGKLDKAFTISGIKVTKGAKAAIESVGGKVTE